MLKKTILSYHFTQSREDGPAPNVDQSIIQSWCWYMISKNINIWLKKQESLGSHVDQATDATGN